MQKKSKFLSRVIGVFIAIFIMATASVGVFAEDTSNPSTTENVQGFNLTGKEVPEILGPYVLEYKEETRSVNSNINTIPTVLGDITISLQGEYKNMVIDCFKHHYCKGYIFKPQQDENNIVSLELIMPEGVRAFSFGMIANRYTVNAQVSVTTDNGGIIEENNDFAGLRNFAFLSEDSDISKIVITMKQTYFSGILLGDICVNGKDLRTMISKNTVSYDSQNYLDNFLNSEEYQNFVLELLDSNAMIKDIIVTKDGSEVSEVVNTGSYDLTFVVASIEADVCNAFKSDYENASNEEILEAISEYTNSDDFDSVVINSSEIKIKDWLVINPVDISVKADDVEKTEGEADPELTYSITSGTLYGSDEFTGNLERKPGEDKGTYDITQGTLALSENYILTFENGVFTINPKPAVIIPEDETPLKSSPEAEKNNNKQIPLEANPKTAFEAPVMILLFVAAASVLTVAIIKKRKD